METYEDNVAWLRPQLRMPRQWVDEVEGGTRVIPQRLHHLLDALHDLGVGERPICKRHSIERCLGRHRVQRERARHQQCHPPCMVSPDDARPLLAILLQDVDGSNVVSDLLLVLLWDVPLPPLL